jgi:16S rRNA (cytidine1402-2'-O)-methyltransferase
MPILYVLATPIGNLKDISLRAIDALREADLILCEDTRVTKKLLGYLQIKNQVLSYHQHSRLGKTDYVFNLLKSGKKVALVSDAGTPGISDPGNRLIEYLTGKMPDLIVSPIPGPSALTAAASVSGFFMDKFVFLGFPPVKKKRGKFFEEISGSKHTVIFYESPYRILKTLAELKNSLAANHKFQTARIVACRELTKKFETIYRGKIDEVMRKINNDKIKGEFTVVVNLKS